MALLGDEMAQRVEVHSHQIPKRKQQLSERASRSLAVEPRDGTADRRLI
jgi:hypothetical protein